MFKQENYGVCVSVCFFKLEKKKGEEERKVITKPSCKPIFGNPTNHTKKAQFCILAKQNHCYGLVNMMICEITQIGYGK